MRYKAFTLVEVLIVMGILVILMAVGITAGRFAIDRANRIHHQDAAEQLYISLEKYKLDNGEYPRLGTCASCIAEQFFAEALGYKGENNILNKYMEKGSFDGGIDATYYYYVDPINAQAVIVCVSLGGVDDEFNKGHYCTGSGIGSYPVSSPIDSKNIGTADDGDPNVNTLRGFDDSDWISEEGFAIN